MYTPPNSPSIGPNHFIDPGFATLPDASFLDSSTIDQPEPRDRKRSSSPTELDQRTVSLKRRRLDVGSDPADKLDVMPMPTTDREKQFAVDLKLAVEKGLSGDKGECLRLLEQLLLIDIELVTLARSMFVAIDERQSDDAPQFRPLIQPAIVQYARVAHASNDIPVINEVFRHLSERGKVYCDREKNDLARCAWQAALDTGCNEPELLLNLAGYLSESRESFDENPLPDFKLYLISYGLLARGYSRIATSSDWDSTFKPLCERLGLTNPQHSSTHLQSLLVGDLEGLRQKERLQISDRLFELQFDILRAIMSNSADAGTTYTCCQNFYHIGQHFVDRLEQLYAPHPDETSTKNYLYTYLEIDIALTSKRDTIEDLKDAARLRDAHIEMVLKCYTEVLSAAKSVIAQTKDADLLISVFNLAQQMQKPNGIEYLEKYASSRLRALTEKATEIIG
jgi:hypothetical protein